MVTLVPVETCLWWEFSIIYCLIAIIPAMDETKLKIDAIIRSNRKTFSLEVSGDAKLTVRVPQRASLDEIKSLVSRKSSWIKEKQKKALERYRKFPAKRFQEGEHFLFLGKSYTLSIHEDPPSPMAFSGEEFILDRDRINDARNLFVRWYRDQAKSIIPERSKWYSSFIGLRFVRVNITGAAKRWGSCSRKKNLNFSWRLIMAPPEIIDYVILHELAHLKEQNHSKRFWNMVSSMCPDYRAYRKWLKENGHTLCL